MEYYSRQISKLIQELSTLPGIGTKSAQRLAFHILNMPKEQVEELSSAILDAKQNVRYCKECFTLTDEEICPICSDSSRNHKVIMVVENTRDLAAYEKTQKYDGVYHVLGGLISPIDGLGPDSLEIASLIERIKEGGIDEIILATGATVEADTTDFYIYRLIRRSGSDVKVTQLARGVAVGNEIEYTDEATLARSLVDRTPFTV